jgi:membrane-bound serine protease (ClpP class)
MLIRLGVRAQQQPPATGESAMIGESGIVVTEIAPARPGRVTTHGEIWRAEANEAIPEGTRVRITAIRGLTLTVRRDEVPS